MVNVSFPYTDLEYRIPRSANIDRIIGKIEPITNKPPYPITHCSLILVPDADGMCRLVVHVLGDESELAAIRAVVDARIDPIIAAHAYDRPVTA